MLICVEGDLNQAWTTSQQPWMQVTCTPHMHGRLLLAPARTYTVRALHYDTERILKPNAADSHA